LSVSVYKAVTQLREVKIVCLMNNYILKIKFIVH